MELIPRLLRIKGSKVAVQYIESCALAGRTQDTGEDRNVNLKLSLLVAVAFAAGIWAYGSYEFSSGWKDGREKLVQEQKAKAEAHQAKVTARQQLTDTTAAAAEQSGQAKTITITNEVIRYVKSPDHVRCDFDDKRVSIKRAAVDNANSIPGFDD